MTLSPAISWRYPLHMSTFNPWDLRRQTFKVLFMARQLIFSKKNAYHCLTPLWAKNLKPSPSKPSPNRPNGTASSLSCAVTVWLPRTWAVLARCMTCTQRPSVSSVSMDRQEFEEKAGAKRSSLHPLKVCS